MMQEDYIRLARGIRSWLSSEKGVEVGEKEILSVMEKSLKVDSFWTARVFLNEGYGNQCLDLEPFEAKDEQEARAIGEKEVARLFTDKPLAEIFEVKVKKRP